MLNKRIRDPRNFEKCRTCDHYSLSHTDERYLKSYCHMVYDEVQKHNPCRCSEFLPKDNLEFLEYLYEKNHEVVP